MLGQNKVHYLHSNFTPFTIFWAHVWLSFCEFRCLSSGFHACLTNALPAELFLDPSFFLFWTEQESFFTENPRSLYDLPGLCIDFSVTVSLLNIRLQLASKYPIKLLKSKQTNQKTLSVPSVPYRGRSLIHCPLLPPFFSFLFLFLLPCFLFPFPRRHRFLCGWGEWLNFTCAKL